MGTGIVSILLHSFSTFSPGHSGSLRALSIAFFVLNILFFILISVTTLLRYVLYPATWNLMLRHPVQSLFLGALPMGFATIVNMFTLVCVPAWGGSSIQVAWAMWWIDAVVSVACCFGLPFQMMTKHKNAYETMTAAWLLPIVAPIVAVASGAVVASVLPNPEHALSTITTSYVLWGTGVPLAFVVLVIYFHRLALGSMAVNIFLKTNTRHPSSGEILYVLGFGVAIILWGFGLVWLFFALSSISRSKFPFNMGWWSFTFPIGVFAMSTLTIGEELPSSFFRALGTTFGVSVMQLWLVVGVSTGRKVLYGSMIEAPCLREMEKASIATRREKQDP
ncbi:uncharacterized protein BDR25DRAFT_326607 [Lindgomyces ingoldianus]|uniref:Uncharacterized protein n=1 Tax=Lindgomyces ingoldianus TaxID=673940 RepID=A0ACB6QQW5_9PLEO|nr:uncharacterized protein BDR25DRAFT_326607 [Lindgomyces ingoldianus]KAF2468953.1 hypothetical protein BDR25DRAFT_326607 [Lindgomyces ingoldianus]